MKFVLTEDYVTYANEFLFLKHNNICYRKEKFPDVLILKEQTEK